MLFTEYETDLILVNEYCTESRAEPDLPDWRLWNETWSSSEPSSGLEDEAEDLQCFGAMPL